MNRASRAGLVALAMVVPVFAGGVARAGMEDSRVSIRYNTDSEHFKGRVSSDEAECRAGRTIKIFKKTRDGRSLQGKDKTNSKGRYSVAVMHANGRYFAVARKYEGMNNLVCKKGRSKTIRV
jgi:hypothetical protein